ncbi:dipeptide ABC transporter ATP-binding protein [Desulfatiferula olefinivorans]
MTKPDGVTIASHADPVLLDVRDLDVWFPVRRGILSRTVGYVKAVSGVSLSINRGETLGLVGESGCGKTTLGRSLLGLEPVRRGRVIFDGRDLAVLRGKARREVRRRMQMVFQDPLASLNPRMSVLDCVTEGMKAFRLADARHIEEKGLALLGEVGLSGDALRRYPHEFSGGQCQRISIARALSLSPDFMVLDEAVSALDVSVQAQVVNLLLDLQEKHGLSYLFISHDLSVVSHIADRIAVMYLGKVVEYGPVSEIIDSPLHPYTRALIEAVPVPGRTRTETILTGEPPSPVSPPPGCPFHTRCPEAAAVCRTAVPALKPVGGRQAACHLRG